MARRKIFYKGFEIHAMQDMNSGECLAYYQGENILWAASMSELMHKIKQIFQ